MVNYFLNMLYRNVSHIVLAFTILFVLRIVPAFPYPQRAPDCKRKIVLPRFLTI